MAYSEGILTLTYDFLLYIIPQLAKYPREKSRGLRLLIP